MEHLADAPIANILILAGVIFLAVGLFGRVGGFIGSIFGNIEAGQNSRVLAGILGAFLIVGGGWLHEQGDKSAAPKSSPASTASMTGAGSTPTASPSPSPQPSAAIPMKADPSPPATAPAPKLSKATTMAKTATSSSPSASTSPPILAANRENLPSQTPATLADDRLVGTWTNVIPIAPDATVIKRIQFVRASQDLDAHFWYACNSAECDYGIHRVQVLGNNGSYDFIYRDRRIVGSIELYSAAVIRLSIDILEVGGSHRWHHNRVLVKSTASEKMLDRFSKYLSTTGQKAWAAAPGGAWSYHIGYTSVDNSAQIALQHCRERAGGDCRILLLNNEVPE
jgi:hypothetical protein